MYISHYETLISCTDIQFGKGALCFTSPSLRSHRIILLFGANDRRCISPSRSHGGFTRQLRDFNALQGNLQFGTEVSERVWEEAGCWRRVLPFVRIRRCFKPLWRLHNVISTPGTGTTS